MHREKDSGDLRRGRYCRVGVFDLCPLALLTFRYDPNLWASFYDTHFVVGAVRLFLFWFFFFVGFTENLPYICNSFVCLWCVCVHKQFLLLFLCIFFGFFLFIKTCHFYGSQTERQTINERGL